MSNPPLNDVETLSPAVSMTNVISSDRSGTLKTNSTMKQPTFLGTHVYSRSGRAPIFLLKSSPSSVSSDVVTPAQLAPSGNQRVDTRTKASDSHDCDGKDVGTIVGSAVGEAEGAGDGT